MRMGKVHSRFIFPALIAQCLSFSVMAQGSPDCTSGPCVKVGLQSTWTIGDDWEFALDYEYLKWCDRNGAIQIEVLAEFLPGDMQCGFCAHGERSWTWSVSGASTYSIDSVGVISSTKRRAYITVGDGGDLVTVTCTVGAASQGSCSGGSSHSGNHGGASNSCTFRLWSVEMTSDADLEYVDATGVGHYKSQFAETSTASLTFYGAFPIYRHWYNSDVAAAHAYNVMSWGGIMVEYSAISCTIHVRNPFVTEGELGWYQALTRKLYLDPRERRPGWNITHAWHWFDRDWGKDDPTWFPAMTTDWKYALGQNTNVLDGYEDEWNTIITPVYDKLADHPDSHAAFNNVVSDVTSGPNQSLWYTSDPTLFKVDRISRCNYWITPEATAPADPATGPNSLPYTNWLSIQNTLLVDTCTCSNPAWHNGIGGNVRYMGNLWHESYGNPFSPNTRLLGHQVVMEDTLASGHPEIYDAVYRCDVLSASSKDGLRSRVMAQHFDANKELHKACVQGMHNNIMPDWDTH